MWYYLQNGQQAGPVPRETLQGLLQSQALAVTVSVWTRGMDGWRPANEVPDLIAGVVGGRLPQPAPGAPYLMTPPSPNGMAIASLILGAIGILGGAIFTSFPAIICGHIARRQIRNAEGREGGDGMAMAGLVMGYLVTLLSLIFIGVVVWAIWYAGVSAPPPRTPSVPVTVPMAP